MGALIVRMGVLIGVLSGRSSVPRKTICPAVEPITLKMIWSFSAMEIIAGGPFYRQASSKATLLAVVIAVRRLMLGVMVWLEPGVLMCIGSQVM